MLNCHYDPSVVRAIVPETQFTAFASILLPLDEMSADFLYTVKRLESLLAKGMLERAKDELASAYVLQPQNPYLAAYAQRMASLMSSPLNPPADPSRS